MTITNLLQRLIKGGPLSAVIGNVQLVNNSNVTKVTTDGEVWTTVTERENDVFSQYSTTIGATTYALMIAKDNPLFPHRIQLQAISRMDITSAYYAIATTVATASGSIRIGVITRIDGADADIWWIIGIPFSVKSGEQAVIESLRGVPSQVKLDFNDSGILQHGVTNLQDTNLAAINTGITLASPIGNLTPAVGDIVARFEHTGSDYSVGLFLFYHGH